MLLTSTIIILREVLEGAIFVSVLLALSSHYGLRMIWAWLALLIGFAGAYMYASKLDTISTWFDYTGQEIMNASIQITIVLLLTVFVLLYRRPDSRLVKPILAIMIVTVALTTTIEGSEILLYLSGFPDNSSALYSVILGGILGAGIGVSIGALLYYLLAYFMANGVVNAAFLILALFSAGMLSHSVQILTQADWLPAQRIIWDTSSLLSETSLLGQLLYAIMGYEATPTANQVVAYVFGVLLILLLPRFFVKNTRPHAKSD
ncbi:MAG: FTR1 family protein [Gammaproteobacteria bacterium]|jgi:high-affinity iron transporter